MDKSTATDYQRRFENNSKPDTRVNDAGQMRICPFMQETRFSGNVPIQKHIKCIQHNCMAWNCLGDFKEHIDGALRVVRKWGCAIMQRR